MNDLISMNAVLEMAVAKGASATYETFKTAVEANADMQRSAVRVPQGPKRTVMFVPRSIGEVFALDYAKKHPKRTPITKPIEQDLTPPVFVADDKLADLAAEINEMRVTVDAMRTAVDAINTKIDKLVAVWECMEDDQK